MPDASDVPKSFNFLQALGIIVAIMLKTSIQVPMQQVSIFTNIINALGTFMLTMAAIIGVSNLYFAHLHNVSPHRLMPLILAFLGMCCTLLVSSLKQLGGHTSSIHSCAIQAFILVFVVACSITYFVVASRRCKSLLT